MICNPDVLKSVPTISPCSIRSGEESAVLAAAGRNSKGILPRASGSTKQGHPGRP